MSELHIYTLQRSRLSAGETVDGDWPLFVGKWSSAVCPMVGRDLGSAEAKDYQFGHGACPSNLDLQFRTTIPA